MTGRFDRRLLRALALLLALALACGLSGCAAGGTDSATSDAAAGTDTAADGGSALAADPDAAPLLTAFVSQRLDGTTVDESMFEGYSVIMLNFWATFCGPCIREMPGLGELAAEYADKGVLIVGLPTDLISQEGMVDGTLLLDALDIIQSTGADYPHILPCQAMQGILAQIYAVPTTVFLDADGRQLGEMQIGAKDKAEWAALLDSLLAEVSA